MEQENNSAELEREFIALESERQKSAAAIENRRNKYAEMLLGDMGKDIDNVLSGKVKVKLPMKDRIKYKVRGFFSALLKFF